MLSSAVRPGESTARRCRVAVLCSRRAPGLEYLLDHASRSGSYRVVGVLASDPSCVERVRLAGKGVPSVVHDIRQFYAGRGAPLADLALRRQYDRRSVGLLEQFRPELIALCGYLHIVTAPVLDAFPGRVINIHDSDLPHYPGLHAVRDAIFAGERETRSTVHLATPEVDGGPALVRSWAFPTHRLIDAARRRAATDILKAYAYAHREWMMGECWGPLLATAIELLASDAVRLSHSRCIIDGALGPCELAPGEQTRPRHAQRIGSHLVPVR